MLTRFFSEARTLYGRLAHALTSERSATEPQGQRILETSHDLIVVTDGYGLITQISPSCLRTLGYRQDEVVGRNGTEIVFPDDLDLVREEMQAARGGSVTRNFRCRHVHKDGHPVSLVWTGVWSEPDSRHYFIGRDMTEIEAKEEELRRSRERAVAADERADAARRSSRETSEILRAVANTSYQAIIAVSPDGNILLWNKAAERMFGYSSEEVTGKPYPRRAPSEEEAAEQRALFARAMAGETLGDLNFTRLHKDGTERHLHGAAAPFYDSFGVLAGAAYLLEDVTRRTAVEEMLRQAQKMEAVGQLTGGVAHDFNNILMVINANVEELLEDTSLSSTQREQLDAIAASGDRAAELTRRLLAFSRKQHLTPQTTDLTELVAGTDRLLRRTLGEQVEVEAIFADDLWLTHVDRSQVEAALVNLCVNARDAMPNGGRLLIETKNVELDSEYASANPDVTPGDYVMLAVSDTGTGIPKSLLDKVFEPFFTTKAVGKGTGLGLSMVYGFIKQSNGHIKIYSEVGRGTTIRIYLPRRLELAREMPRAAASQAMRGNERILVVEDDDQVRASVARQVRGLGYTVTEAASGEAALKRLDDGETFDLMLTDVVMPGIGGLQLARAAAERAAAMKVVFMSGYSEIAAIQHGRLDPDANLLSKPFRKVDLAARLREALNEA
jgi:PAS domain S-box-containing protein